MWLLIGWSLWGRRDGGVAMDVVVFVVFVVFVVVVVVFVVFVEASLFVVDDVCAAR